jgi:hypothetical protein
VIYFSAEDVAALNQGREDAHRQLADLLKRYVLQDFKTEGAREHATHGYCRRLGLLVRAIDQVYDALPPDQKGVPEPDKVSDATIAIQSFIVNTFGCLDNLAWIWKDETGQKGEDRTELKPAQIGLFNRNFRRSFSDDFRILLNGYQR